METFFTGLAIGFIFSIPVGPVGVLCIRKTLMSGWCFGFFTGLGAALADALYALLAIFGVMLISHFLLQHGRLFRLVESAFLITWGIKMMYTKPPAASTPQNGRGAVQNGLLGFLLTLTNPMTFVAFSSVFSTFVFAGQNNLFDARLVLVFGVFIGSAAWWCALSTMTVRFKHWLSNLHTLNRVTGLTLAGLGGVIAFSPIF